MRQSRLVEAEKRDLNVFYRLAGPEVFQLWRTLREVGSVRLAEIDRLVENYLTDRRELEAVDKEELLRLIKDGAVIVIDTRPEAEYEQGHIATARSIPIENLDQRLAELPRDAEIVAYCRGPYCVYSDEAVRGTATRPGGSARACPSGGLRVTLLRRRMTRLRELGVGSTQEEG